MEWIPPWELPMFPYPPEDPVPPDVWDCPVLDCKLHIEILEVPETGKMVQVVFEKVD